MALCQLCETVHGAVRTAAGVLSHWSPGEGGGMKGREWAGDSLKGDARQGSSMLAAGCPSLKKNNWRRTLPPQKHLKGKRRWKHAALYSPVV